MASELLAERPARPGSDLASSHPPRLRVDQLKHHAPARPADPRASALTALLVIAALVCLVGEYVGLRALIYVAKPLATIAALLLAALTKAPVSPRYRTLITAGLAASLAGDVFLMLPGDRFVAGLASFLVAHLLYIAAFASEKGGLRSPAAATTIGLFAVAMLAFLWPDLGALRLPVAAYVAVIAVMGWQAFARWGRSSGAELAALGATSFLVSDSALAIGRFRGEFTGGTLLVLGSYWLAQWLIARSVARAESRRRTRQGTR